MSLILDALRKLDRERNAGSPGRRDIAAELLKAGDSPSRSGLFALAIALGVTASVAALATFLVLGGTGERTASVSARSPAPAAQASQAAAVPLPHAPATGADTPSAPQAAPPASSPGTAALPTDRAIKDGGAAATPRATGKGDVAAKAPSRPEAPSASRPAVKISAIIWQEEPSERKAAINGRAVRQGETIDGMKVLEIHPSHVKLSFEGRTFTAGMYD